jgi:hypothetical protein
LRVGDEAPFDDGGDEGIEFPTNDGMTTDKIPSRFRVAGDVRPDDSEELDPEGAAEGVDPFFLKFSRAAICFSRCLCFGVVQKSRRTGSEQVIAHDLPRAP